MAGLRGAGKMYLNVYRNSAWTGYLDMSNIASFSIGNSGSDKITLKSTAPSNYGAVIGSSTTPGDDTISITLNDPNRKNLATMLLGSDADVTVTGATQNNEAHTLLAKGTFLALGKRKLTSSSVNITKGDGTGTYSEGTDFTVDADNGLIYFPLTSTIPTGSLLIDYTYGNYSGYRISARTETSITCKMLFTGENLDSGEIIRVTADSVELSPEGDFNLISADNAFLEFQLTGTIKVPTGETVPFYVDIIG
jgi:hypothetical protein